MQASTVEKASDRDDDRWLRCKQHAEANMNDKWVFVVRKTDSAMAPPKNASVPDWLMSNGFSSSSSSIHYNEFYSQTFSFTKNGIPPIRPYCELNVNYLQIFHLDTRECVLLHCVWHCLWQIIGLIEHLLQMSHFSTSEPMVATAAIFIAAVAAASRIGFILQSCETIKSR